MVEGSSHSAKDLLELWQQKIAGNQKAHEEASRWAAKKNSLFGYPAAALSAVVGSAVFTSVFANEALPVGWRIVAVVMSFLAAIFSAVQTYAAYSELAEKHRVAAADYANLNLDIAQALYPPPDDAEAEEVVNAVKERFKQSNATAPRIPKKAQRKAGTPPPEVG